jgi:RNA polymerase sigma-70 factor (ECF subfamily)
MTDAELARSGGERAFAELYRRFAPLAASIARRLLRDTVEADDVVQETFMIVFLQLERLVDPDALRRWIVQIAISRAYRRIRRRSLAMHDVEIDRQVSPELGPELRVELQRIVRALYMPATLRVPWTLHHVVGAELVDIAAACECSVATIKRRIAEADAVVARRISDHRAASTTGKLRDASPRSRSYNDADET